MADSTSGPIAALRALVDGSIGLSKQVIGILLDNDRLQEQGEAQQQKAAAQRQQRTCSILEAAGLLKPGDPLSLVTVPRSELTLDDSEKQATYLGRGKVRWKHDEKEYSLSRLTSHICTQHGYPGQSIQGPAYWGNPNTQVNLVEQAKSVAQATLG